MLSLAISAPQHPNVSVRPPPPPPPLPPLSTLDLTTAPLKHVTATTSEEDEDDYVVDVKTKEIETELSELDLATDLGLK